MPQPAPPRIYDPQRPPRLWSALLTDALGADPRLAGRVWRHFRTRASQEEIHWLIRAQRRQDPQSMAALLQLITPARLCRLLEQMSPSGQVRDKQIVALEAAILRRMVRADLWR